MSRVAKSMSLGRKNASIAARSLIVLVLTVGDETLFLMTVDLLPVSLVELWLWG